MKGKSMPRVALNVRVQPIYKEVVEEKALDIQRSTAFIVEQALFEMFKNTIGHGNPPGKKMEDE
jgi:hypothetical protein